MEKQSGSRIKLGIFVTVGVALFIAAIYFVGERQQLFSPTFHVSGIFKDISGLQVGNNVRLAGINVGIVEDLLQITDSTVKVDMKINNKSKKFIKKNTRAIIGSDGLMGNKIVILMAGAPGAPEVADNDILVTSQPVNLDEIMVKIKDVATNAADITGDLSAIIGNIRNGKGTMGKIFMDTAFAKNIDKTVVNLKQGMGGFKQNMDAAGHSFLLRGFLKKKNRDKKNKDKDKEKDK